MFDLDLISLLNKYENFKSLNDIYSMNKIKLSISNLILQNKEMYNLFISNHSLDLSDSQKKLLDSCSIDNSKIKKEEKNKDLIKSDSDYIKDLYFKWKKEYIANDYKININQEILIDKIIKRFALIDLSVILKVLEIKDDSNFEIFKNLLKNRLRFFFIKKIKEFREGDSFKKNGFFEKIKLKKKIFKIYKKLGHYDFDEKLIKEVLNKR